MIKFALACFITLTGFYSHAWKEFHGGDQVALEFKKIALSISQELFEIPTLPSGESFQISLLSVSVPISLTKDRLSLQGVPKVAITVIEHSRHGHDSSRIYINVDRWANLDLSAKEMLVIHEYLHVLGQIDDDYTFSSDLYNKIIALRQIKSSHLNTTDYVLMGLSKCSFKELFFACNVYGTEEVRSQLSQLQYPQLNSYCPAVHDFIVHLPGHENETDLFN